MECNSNIWIAILTTNQIKFFINKSKNTEYNAEKGGNCHINGTNFLCDDRVSLFTL